MNNTQINVQKEESIVTIIRLYSDEAGTSHFGSIDLKMNLVDFAPPAPKVFLSNPNSAKVSFFLSLPPKWFGDFHPVPSRQIMTLITGSLEVEVGDATKRIFKPGDTALVEDTTGLGHVTRNNSDQVAVLSVIQL